MKLKGFTLLAAETSRSQVYLETFSHYGLYFDNIILLKKSKPSNGLFSLPSINIKKNSPHEEMYEPLFNRSIDQLAESVTDNISIIYTESIKDQKIVERINEIRPKFTIYSGFGGQIVPKILLDQSVYIHAHAGWLPDYRGSTTIYYSLINDNDCAVSVITLEPNIDSGVILSRKRYSAPNIDIDIDHIYDNQIRADLLSKTIMNYIKNGMFDMSISQNEDESTTYYVIHPILKHIAKLSLESK
jgi:methionyl-tRNA formyltransferase